MAYAQLKTDIAAVIRNNGNQEITGNVLQGALLEMINALGANYQYAGVADTSTTITTTEANVFYLLTEAGTYANMSSSIVHASGIGIALWNGSAWSYQNVPSSAIVATDATPTENSTNPVQSGGVYDAIETSITYDVEYTNLDNSSAYYLDTLSGAYMVAGTMKITSNQYTSNYILRLFNLPAGTYRFKTTTNAKAGQSIIIGKIDSTEDFVVGGTISERILVGDGTAQESVVDLSQQTLVVLLTLNGDGNYNRYGSIEEGDDVSLKEAIENVDERVDDAIIEINGIKGDMSGKTLAVLHNGLPMIDKLNSTFVSITTTGRTLTPRVLSNFLLDMHFVGTPTSGCKYGLSGFQYGKNSNVNYANYLYIWRENADSSVTQLANYQIGKNAPTGIVEHTIELSNDSGVSKCILLLDWAALSEIDSGDTSYSYFKLTNNGYVFDQTYLFGEIGQAAQRGKVAKLEDDVEVLQSEIGNPPVIVIPSLVYAIAGTELNIWNDCVCLSADKGIHSPINYQVRWSCNKGTITERCFRYTPADADAGNDYTCTCYVYNNNFILLGQKSFTIRVKAKNALSSAKKIAYFGDSLGANTAMQLYSKFNNAERFSGTAPTMVGTRGTTPKYEAVGGFRWVDYATKGTYAYRVNVTGISSLSVGAVYSITISGTTKNLSVREVNVTEGSGNILLEAAYGARVANFPATGTLTYVSGTGDATISFTGGAEESGNPLWNDQTNQLDIAQYKTLCGLQSTDKIDAVSFQFGINDTFDATTITGYISALYDAFIADNANCKFIVGMPPTMGNDTNGWGANYGAGGNGYIAYKQKLYNFHQLYLSLIESGDYPNMRLATPNLEIDRYYGYAFSTRPISQEYTTTEEYHNNAVHPATSGYSQAGDAYLAAFVATLTEA